VALVLGAAPRLGEMLARKPQLMDGLIDPRFFGAMPDKQELSARLAATVQDAGSYEEFLDRLRLFGQESLFLIGTRILSGTVSAQQASTAFADVAEGIVHTVHGLVADRFAAQHREMATARPDQDGPLLRVNMAESPLARLKYRDLIDPMQFAAGEKLRRDYTLGQLAPRMGVDLGAPGVSGGGRGGAAEHLSDVVVAARQRVNRALAAMGPGLADLLFDVCCELLPLEDVEARRGWAKRSGRVVLKIALDRLAAHYGLSVTAPAKSRMRGWTMEEAS